MSVKVNESRLLHQGRVFTMVKENITLQNGVTVDIDIIRHPGAAAIVPMTDSGNIVMIRQYRHALGGFIWEIPAGTRDGDEAPLSCAKRELAEETGFSAQNWVGLGEITPVPGYSDERIHLFLASGLETARGNPDDDEILDVHQIEFGRIMEMVRDGQIQDGKTIAGLFMARYHLMNEEGNRLPL